MNQFAPDNSFRYCDPLASGQPNTQLLPGLSAGNLISLPTPVLVSAKVPKVMPGALL